MAHWTARVFRSAVSFSDGGPARTWTRGPIKKARLAQPRRSKPTRTMGFHPWKVRDGASQTREEKWRAEGRKPSEVRVRVSSHPASGGEGGENGSPSLYRRFP